jgi:riboflavin synthase alpha subunit
MFTGIVEDVGTVASLSPLRAGTALTVTVCHQRAGTRSVEITL